MKKGNLCSLGHMEMSAGLTRWMVFFTSVNIEGTDDGMAGDGAGVWGCGGG